MSTDSQTVSSTPKAAGRARRWALMGGGGILLLIVAAIAIWWLLVMEKAEGIAIGYLQAAGAAYQVGRPIPDTIFETGGFRVQAVSGVAGGQPSMTVYVRDRWLNITLLSKERCIVSPGFAR